MKPVAILIHLGIVVDHGRHFTALSLLLGLWYDERAYGKLAEQAVILHTVILHNRATLTMKAIADEENNGQHRDETRQRAADLHKIFAQRYALVIDALVGAFADRLETVVLFGSQARNKARADSDHDLFVVIANLPTDPLFRQRAVRSILLPILADLPGAINFIAKTPEEVAANLTPLLLDVCVDGICLYGEAYFEPYRQRALAALRQSKLQRRRVGGALMWVFPQLPTSDWELSWEGYFERTR